MKQDIQVVQPIVATALPWQNDVILKLIELQQKKRLPHAILIELQTVVDSQSFGWQLATALLCQQHETDSRPCGSCHHCQLMQANNYPDFTYTTLIDNERTHKLNKDIKIDQIRKLIHQITLTPNLDGGKFALIYPAERMNQSSANSLLKTLEEPAADSTLILITHNPGRLPITIRSRCQRWTVLDPPLDVARTWLKDNAMDSDQIDAYLALAHSDAQLALQLSSQNVLPQLEHFRELLKSYLNNQIDIVSMISDLKSMDNGELRQIVKDVLLSLVYQQLKGELSLDRKQKLIAILNLINHSNFALQTEENNLIFQLQLEDVLISLKQILNLGKNHARSEPGNTVTQHQG